MNKLRTRIESAVMEMIVFIASKPAGQNLQKAASKRRAPPGLYEIGRRGEPSNVELGTRSIAVIRPVTHPRRSPQSSHGPVDQRSNSQDLRLGTGREGWKVSEAGGEG